MEKYDHRLERATRDVVSRSIFREMRAGRTTPNGGVHLQMHHHGPDKVRRQFKGMVERCADCGFDLAGGLVEVVPTAHYMMGGVVFGPDCTTGLEGLFAAGEDTGGVHGANRLVGNGVANSTVFGGIAGDTMARFVPREGAIAEPDKAALEVGRDPSSQYWYIPNPYVYTEYCRVWGEYATFEGNQLLVPVVTPPATPTSTGTPLPTLEFKMEGRGKQTCNGAHWMNIEVTNLSEKSFKYIRIEMQDTTNNISRSVTYNNFPHSVGCDKLIVEDMILGLGSSEIVSGPRFDYNLSGSRLIASVTICSEEDLKGICTTRELKLNP